MEFLPLEINKKSVYAGFWQRFGAAMVDALVLLPFIVALQLVSGESLLISKVVAIASGCMFSLYNVYFHAKFGGTVGKLAVGVRVTKPDGTAIGWPEAFMRSLVDMLFAGTLIAANLWSLSKISPELFHTLSLTKRTELVQSFYPGWVNILVVLQYLWTLSEMFVLLFNKRKRALHDFIAGTVVVRKECINKENRQ